MSIALLGVALALWLLGPRPVARSIGPTDERRPRQMRRLCRRRPARGLRARRARAQRPDPADLEAFIDLLAVVLGAGGTVAGALRVAAASGPSSLRPTLAAAVAARSSGAPLAVALQGLAAAGDGFEASVRALVAAERDGAPLGSTLQVLAAESATAREVASAASARTLSVRVLLPLVCCSLPAVIVGVVVPLLLTSSGDAGLP